MTGKRFKNVEEELYWGTIQYFTYNDEKITDDEIEDLVNQLLEENEQLKSKLKLILEKKYHKFVNGEIGDFKIEDLELGK